VTPFSPSLSPTLTSLSNPSSWIYDDDIDAVLDEDDPQAQGGYIGSGVNNVGIPNSPRSFRVVPLEADVSVGHVNFYICIVYICLLCFSDIED